MNKWVSFFRNKKNLFLLLFSLLIVLIIFSGITGQPQIINAGVNRVTVPFGEAINWIQDRVGKLNGKQRIKSNRIAELEIEVASLRKQLIDDSLRSVNIEELKSLKDALKYKDGNRYNEYISTTVIGANDGNYASTILLSAGKKSGVSKHSIVVTQKGLVGVVYETQDYSSKAYSLLNSKLSISIETARDPKIQGIVSQNIFINTKEPFDGYLKGYLFDKNQQILPGDTVITSGVGIYAPGIPVGKVEKVLEDQTNLLKYIKIKPFANFKDLNKVMIYIPRPEKDD